MSSIFRRIIEKVWGVERVAEMISDAALIEISAGAKSNSSFEKYGEEIGKRVILSCDKTRGTSTKASPWLLAPILEREGLAFRSYSPSKGEILSLYNHGNNKMMRSDQDNSNTLYGGGGGGEVSLNSFSVSEADTDTKLVGSSHGWLASFNDVTRDFFLLNPRSGRRIRLPPVPQGRAPSKVIISCSPEDEDCRALMSFGHNRLAFCCPADEEEEEEAWTPIGSRHQIYYGLLAVRSYDDFVYSAAEKRFFAVLDTDVDVVECWDLRDPQSPRMDWNSVYSHNMRSLEDLSKEEEEAVELPDKDWCRKVRYLVSANQQLFLVTRYIMEYDDDQEDSRTIGFDVHRIDQGRKLHRMNNSLDGLVMFLGINHSIALDPSSSRQFKPNSIYFTHHKGCGAQDIGIFDFKNANFCSYNLQRFKRIQPPPFWFYCG